MFALELLLASMINVTPIFIFGLIGSAGVGCASLILGAIQRDNIKEYQEKIGWCKEFNKDSIQKYKDKRNDALTDVTFCNKLLAMSKNVFLISLLVVMIPTADNLWKVRMSMIKFHMASPQNVEKVVTLGSKGIENLGVHIERVFTKVEKKYLDDGVKDVLK